MTARQLGGFGLFLVTLLLVIMTYGVFSCSDRTRLVDSAARNPTGFADADALQPNAEASTPAQGARAGGQPPPRDTGSGYGYASGPTFQGGPPNPAGPMTSRQDAPPAAAPPGAGQASTIPQGMDDGLAENGVPAG